MSDEADTSRNVLVVRPSLLDGESNLRGHDGLREHNLPNHIVTIVFSDASLEDSDFFKLAVPVRFDPHLPVHSLHNHAIASLLHKDLKDLRNAMEFRGELPGPAHIRGVAINMCSS